VAVRSPLHPEAVGQAAAELLVVHGASGSPHS
jgi:hypothetical protein